MKTQRLPLIASMLACRLSSPVARAASSVPALRPTLIRTEGGPFDERSAVTVSVDNCMALIESYDLAGAMTAVDAAVSARRARGQSSWATFVSGGERERLAIAYNDRTVLHCLSGGCRWRRSSVHRR